ncbi:IPT/TIG domain-containing protein [Chloroflexota bacterium]
MKHRKLFSFIAAIIISLLVMAIPAKPVLAQTVSVNLTSGVVGTMVTVSGTGFAGGQTYSVTFGYGSAFAQLVVPTTGIISTFFSASFSVPSVPRGSYTIQAITTPGNFSSLFTITPKTTVVGTTQGYIDDQVTISGSGFNASSSVDIYFDTSIAGTVTATSSGAFNTATFTVPESSRGSHTVRGKDASGYSSGFSFTTLQKIAINPISGAVGDQVTISGTGFTANSTIAFYMDNVRVSTDATTTNASGSFANNTFAIPSSSQGSHTIEAEDGAGYSSTATLSIGQKLTITPTSGISGTTVTVTGSGFSTNASISVKYNGVPVTTNPATISADANGSFTGSFKIPAGLGGTYPVDVTDGTYNSSANFESTTDATISQVTSAESPGHVGMELTINGTGFKPDATVTITFTSEPVVLATVPADKTGTFSVTVTIPPSIGGEHTITVTDEHTTREFPFVMESEAPPVPLPLLPEMGIKAEQPVHFDWEDVTDPSGVTYTLQVATDEDFIEDSIVLEKKELTDTEYTITEEEKLPSVKEEAPYYWRVQVIDDASNASEWTGTGSFYVGFPWPELKGWMLYVLMGIGGLLLLVLGFWLGRRTAYY